MKVLKYRATAATLGYKPMGGIIFLYKNAQRYV